MATAEELREKIARLKEKLNKKIESSSDPSVDRDVRLVRKKIKRTQRKLRLLLQKEQKKAAQKQKEAPTTGDADEEAKKAEAQANQLSGEGDTGS